MNIKYLLVGKNLLMFCLAGVYLWFCFLYILAIFYKDMEGSKMCAIL